MVLGHNDNIELSAVNITLGGTAAGLTAMMVKLLKPQFQYFYQFYNPLSRQRKTKIFCRFGQFFQNFELIEVSLSEERRLPRGTQIRIESGEYAA